MSVFSIYNVCCVSYVSDCPFNRMADADAERSDAVITVPNDVSISSEPEANSHTNHTIVSLLDYVEAALMLRVNNR